MCRGTIYYDVGRRELRHGYGIPGRRVDRHADMPPPFAYENASMPKEHSCEIGRALDALSFGAHEVDATSRGDQRTGRFQQFPL